jgi:hypothetical protein
MSHDPRLVKHVEAIARAGTDLDAFIAALDALRTDHNVPSAGKQAILKTLAQDQAIQYVAAFTGKTLRPLKPQQG